MNKYQLTIFSLTCPIIIAILIAIVWLYEKGFPVTYIIIIATIGAIIIISNCIAIVLSRNPEGVYKAIIIIRTICFLYAAIGVIIVAINLIKLLIA